MTHSVMSTMNSDNSDNRDNSDNSDNNAVNQIRDRTYEEQYIDQAIADFKYHTQEFFTNVFNLSAASYVAADNLFGMEDKFVHVIYKLLCEAYDVTTPDAEITISSRNIPDSLHYDLADIFSTLRDELTCRLFHTKTSAGTHKTLIMLTLE